MSINYHVQSITQNMTLFAIVSRDILLKNLYAYGIRGNAFKLLKSYLTNQTQFVVYDGIPSCTLPINCGVP